MHLTAVEAVQSEDLFGGLKLVVSVEPSEMAIVRGEQDMEHARQVCRAADGMQVVAQDREKQGGNC